MHVTATVAAALSTEGQIIPIGPLKTIRFTVPLSIVTVNGIESVPEDGILITVPASGVFPTQYGLSLQ